MTSKEDFKQAIRRGNINEAFLVAMSNAPELNITTKIVTADGQKLDIGERADNSLHTHINLIEGKVENEIGEKLTGDRYSEIKQFHIQQVTQGHQTIQQNLLSLQKMFQLMSSFEQQQAANHSSWVDIAADVSRESLPAQENHNQLRGNIPNALAAGKENEPPQATDTVTSISEANLEPQLPSFDVEDDEMVNDLLSLADIDEVTEAAESETRVNQADWSEWLEDEPDVKSEVFDLKSLNIHEAKENWQNWEEQNEAIALDADAENHESE
ncbi:MAG: hypothetical protein AAFO95_10615 [Cyanobacteria bacterium J06600_6]